MDALAPPAEDSVAFAEAAKRMTAFLGAMRSLAPAIDAGREIGAIPGSALATRARVYWMQSQTALACAALGFDAAGTRQHLCESMKVPEVAPYAVSTLSALDRRRAGLAPRPAPTHQREARP